MFYLFTLKTIIKCNANNVYLIENVILTEYNKDNKDNKYEFNLINSHTHAGDYIKNSYKRSEFVPKEFNNKFFLKKIFIIKNKLIIDRFKQIHQNENEEGHIAECVGDLPPPKN